MKVRSLMLAAALLAFAAPLLAGPPWVSVEMPANPFDQGTRGAYFIVRTYHHGNPIALQVRGTLEGIVDGRRVSRPATFERSGTIGVWALRTAPPADGAWVVVVLAGEGNYSATALVDVSEGMVRGVDVPYDRREGWSIPRAVGPAEIDARLRELAAAGGGALLAKPGHGSVGLPLELILLGAAVGLAPIGAFAFWRARRR
jgi:hypothetical protein